MRLHCCAMRVLTCSCGSVGPCSAHCRGLRAAEGPVWVVVVAMDCKHRKANVQVGVVSVRHARFHQFGRAGFLQAIMDAVRVGHMRSSVSLQGQSMPVGHFCASQLKLTLSASASEPDAASEESAAAAAAAVPPADPMGKCELSAIGWLVAWSSCGCMLLRSPTVWLLPFTLL